MFSAARRNPDGLGGLTDLPVDEPIANPTPCLYLADGTVLTLGAQADRQYLRRSGTGLVGWSPFLS